MRAITALLLALCLLMPGVASAEGFSEALIDDAKQALTLLSYGEYKRALKMLDLKGGDVSARTLRAFVEEELIDLPYVTVQTDVAVAYRYKAGWRVAVPIEEPIFGGVQTFMLRAKDGKQFDAYRAATWDDLLTELESAEETIWRDKYTPDKLYILADDQDGGLYAD